MSHLSLVDIAARFPTLPVDLKYATADNITGQPIYREARCLLHPDAAVALEKSIAIAALAGYRLLVLDAYRPQRAQQLLWNACPNQDYVVPANIGSNHCLESRRKKSRLQPQPRHRHRRNATR